MTNENKPLNFIKHIINEDLAAGKNNNQVITRFPPEPNGYLHIGHAKSICLNFGIANEYPNARCHLRFDDTNPTKEEVEYVKSIQKDIKWLGFDWGGNLFYASDYFEKFYQYAVQLVKMGKAYVCSLNAEQMREYRGTLNAPGKESPSRNTSVEENLELFEQMRRGEFGEGERVLRAKIDMNSPNINLRDPVIYRILKVQHHRTKNQWQIYPMYDFAHCLSDMIEGITHSICTLEFEDHRPLYDWYLDTLKTPCHPQQIEFARLNLNYTVMSKRKFLELVTGKYVDGWNDPRMPTIGGLRARGYTPKAIRTFAEEIGVTKKESCIDLGVLENCIRNDLENDAPRAMAVLDPIKIIITNYPDDQTEELECANHPKKPELGSRKVPFSKEIYIEKNDFMENPPKDFYRLSPGGYVRLRYAYVIKCEKVIKDASGEILELHCRYLPETKHGVTPEGMKKIKGIIHWVAAKNTFCDVEVRVYDRLFTEEFPDANKDVDFITFLNPDSLIIKKNAKLESSLALAKPGSHFQFERQGYFFVAEEKTKDGKLIFNRTVTLKDTWAKNLVLPTNN
jgi:glutaminyl-tRNA synthetase